MHREKMSVPIARKEDQHSIQSTSDTFSIQKHCSGKYSGNLDANHQHFFRNAADQNTDWIQN